MAVSKEFVVSAFLKYLGRPPESEKTLTFHMECKSEEALVNILLRSAEHYRNKFSKIKFDPAATKKIFMIGTCQAYVAKKLIDTMSPQVSVISIGLESANLNGLQSGNLDISRFVEESDLVVFQMLPDAALHKKLIELYPEISKKIRYIPSISYTAFHPDMGYIVRADGSHLGGPMGDYHSLIAFWAWKNDLSLDEARKLYRHDVYEFLGYFSHTATADHFLIGLGEKMGVGLQSALARWKSTGCFMHSINHPKLFVLADLSRILLAKENIEYIPDVEDYLFDELSNHPCWPIYPEIGQALGVRGNYIFKQARGLGTEERPVPTLTLDKYLELAYKNYDANRQSGIKPAVDSEVFNNLSAYLSERKKTDQESVSDKKKVGGNPYAKLKNYQFWRRAVAAPDVADVDPVVFSNLQLNKNSKVATAGSCFAQHISRTLSNNGFTYYVAENGSEMSLEKDELVRLNYGVFSARYGNIYTSRQLVQLFDRAYGTFTPLDAAWERKDGRFVDPFRPLVNPDGYSNKEEVKIEQASHFKHIRDMFENLDVFVFTLGLTESWRRKEDGAVFPLAPGVEAGLMDLKLYEFVNFETHDVIKDLEYFLEGLSRVNPSAKVIFTVSPVPLIATYENRHVLTSTTYSKSALRSAADYIVRRYAHCEYFPSYEIITGSYNKSAYFEEDLRSVREEGVSHVMRLFMQHYSSEATPKARPELDAKLLKAAEKNNAIVCDEEALDPATD